MSLLLKALMRQPVSRPPVWLMRQAGRYLPEYRAVRAHFPNFITFCLTPDAATEVTLQPVTRFDLDAAIIFADILTIPHALGLPVTFTEGHGPHVTPLTSPAQLADLAAHLPEIPHRLAAVAQTVSRTRAALPVSKAVLGFSGAPFTLAAYMLDAKPSQGIPHLLKLASEEPAAFDQLLKILTQAVTTYLSTQMEAGATAVQLFESWALACPENLWQKAVHQPLLTIAKALQTQFPQTPVILFPRGATPAQLEALAHSAPAALSLSTEIDLTWATQTLQPHVAIQGNLNPTLTEGAPTPLLKALQHQLDTAAPHPGYIVNLGHGLTPQTRPENIQLIVDTVKSWRSQSPTSYKR
jgi:uroporphyrinogen decarboxylase